MSGEDEKFMEMAIEEARNALQAGEQPFGSVVVRDGEVVARTRNLVNSSGDPTTHAETMAVREAAAALKSPVLKGCTLYTSCEPCPMCVGAMMFANLERLVISANSEAFARIAGRPSRPYSVERLVEMMNVKLEVVRGVLSDEAEKLLGEHAWS